MKIVFSILLFFLMSIFYGQNKALSLGSKKYGICFGNSSEYNGLRLNVVDKNVNTINGVNFSGYSLSKKSNGISVGILGSFDSISNGLKIGGLGVQSIKHNGLAVGGILLIGKKYNGVGLSVVTIADTLNGFFGGALCVGSKSNGKYTAKVFNGVALAFLLTCFEKQNGVSIALLNKTEELHGFQFGLINKANNNRPPFRCMPFLNFNLRKKKV